MVTASQLQELEALEQELGHEEGTSGVSFTSRVQYLRLVRKLHLRRATLVASHGLAILNDSASRKRLGDEVWDVLEQVAVAAMDVNSLDLAKECIGALMVKFKKSARVGRLEGMWLEANGWWDQADRLYGTLLQDHPQDQKVMKRRVAVLKAQGKLQEASGTLRIYLEIYQADLEAWRELADLYLAQSMLKQAAFCLEELLLSNPANPLYNLQYAETLKLIGGVDNLNAAKSYYAAAIEHSAGESTRALWGVCMVEAELKQMSTKSSKAVKGDGGVSSLAKAAAEMLSRQYKTRCPSLLDFVDSTLIELGCK